jgi:hypothetical protein
MCLRSEVNDVLAAVKYLARIASADWERLRILRIAEAHGKCERCRRYRPNSLQLHHLHYRTLGKEQRGDLELLCCECHEDADSERRATVRHETEQRHWARVLAWAESDGMQRVRGEGWWEGRSWDDVEDEFYRFIEEAA